MPFFLKITAIWSFIKPFLTTSNWLRATACFDRACINFKEAKDADIVVKMLVCELTEMFPGAPEELLDAMKSFSSRKT